MVKLPPTVWETWVQSLGGEDLLEKGMATHFSTLAWKILWTEEPGRLQSMGSQRVRHDLAASLSFHFSSFLLLVSLFSGLFCHSPNQPISELKSLRFYSAFHLSSR